MARSYVWTPAALIPFRGTCTLPNPCDVRAREIIVPEPRLAMAFDPELWKPWEGYVVDGTFLLERCIGGSARGAVFETRFQDQPAAIKIVPGTSESTGALLASWETVAKLSHENLVQTFAGGETVLGDTPCAYLVTELADDNLAEVLAERPLTSDETRDMLTPVLCGLRYLHSNGFTHGSVKASNVMAFGEQLKIPTDTAVPSAASPADCYALGVLIEEALGGDSSGALPEPFGEIVRNCRNPERAARWDVARIEERLRIGLSNAAEPSVRSESPVSPPISRQNLWGLATAVVVILGLVAMWPSRGRGIEQDTARQSSANADTTVASAATSAPKRPSASAASSPANANLPVKSDPVTLEGIRQVMPDIPQTVLNTINGRVLINVRVRVDRAGKVSEATLEAPSASKYFADRVLAAAESWTFPPGSAPQDWVLRFELTRGPMRVSPARAASR